MNLRMPVSTTMMDMASNSGGVKIFGDGFLNIKEYTRGALIIH